ncbi:MAG: threonine/serine exporter family protein [Planctomycetes bacterium]|nr:threonine/serine exporter family protein [Planctomycetota bacterium]
MFSNLLARWRRLPAALSTVPGLLILVPGSTGFRSLSSFLGLRASDGTDPTDLLVGMVAIGVALVCGLLVANVLLPSRRSL